MIGTDVVKREWDEWFARHPDHRIVGFCILHTQDCGLRCLKDAPGSSFERYLLRRFAYGLAAAEQRADEAETALRDASNAIWRIEAWEPEEGGEHDVNNWRRVVDIAREASMNLFVALGGSASPGGAET